MEERKLNFNAPLLSVRRSSMASGSSARVNEKKSENFPLSRGNTLPVARPHFNLDQVTEPVAVPFHWEQIPGRAKNDSGPASPETQLPQPPERTSTTPRLSFGRAMDAKKHILEIEARHRNRCEANSFNSSGARLESTKAIINVNDTKSSASDNDDDDDYSDALDTLSPTDSFSVNNCSVSGLSGYNGPAVKPSGTFRTDPQTRDFLMSRFLPAAKAMVLEPAKYALRKQLVVAEQPRQAKKVTCENRMSSLKQIESPMLLQYGKDEVDEESDIVDDECDNSGNILARGCGLIPNLCFKNSLCLLNPVPGMRIRTESPMSFTNKVGGSGRVTYSQSHSQKIKKPAGDAAYKQKPEAAVGSPKLQEVKDKLISESKQFPSSSDLQMRGRYSPFRHSRAASSLQNEASETPCRKQLLAVPKEKSKMLSVNKGDIDFCDTPSVQATKQGFDPASALIEKTLYVDTMSVAEISSSLNSNLLDAKETIDHVGEKNETAFETRVMEETTAAESSFPEVKYLTLDEEGKLEREVAESKSKDVTTGGSKMDHGLDKEEFLGCSNVSISAAGETESCEANYQIVKVEDPASVKIASVISSQPPPLPKSPSESWLWRTLPSVSSKKLFVGSNLGDKLHHKKQNPKTSASNTKWETIVKTSSNLHHDHVRYSEELIPHVSQHSKTQKFK